MADAADPSKALETFTTTCFDRNMFRNDPIYAICFNGNMGAFFGNNCLDSDKGTSLDDCCSFLYDASKCRMKNSTYSICKTLVEEVITPMAKCANDDIAWYITVAMFGALFLMLLFLFRAIQRTFTGVYRRVFSWLDHKRKSSSIGDISNQLRALLKKNLLLWKVSWIKYLRGLIFALVPCSILIGILLKVTSPNKSNTFSKDVTLDGESSYRDLLEDLMGKEMIDVNLPYESVDYGRIKIYQYLRPVLGLLIYISFVNSIAGFVSDLVNEKHFRVKDYIRITGVSSWIQFLADAIAHGFKSIPLSLALALLTKFGQLFPNQEFVYLFLFYYTFMLAMTGYANIIAIFFSKSKPAIVTAITIMTALYIIVFRGLSLPHADQIWYSLIAPVGLGLGVNSMVQEASFGPGAELAIYRFNQRDNPQKLISIQTCIGMFIVDTFLYYFLAWYLDKVVPQQDGATLPWYFIFSDLSNFLGITELYKNLRQRYKIYERQKSVSRLELGLQSDSAATSKSQLEIKFIDTGANFEPPSKEELECIRQNRCVTTQNLRRHFRVRGLPEGRVATNNVNVQFYENQITCLLGHNGAGKSTLFAILIGLLQPSSGDATIYGYSLKNELLEVRRLMGFCPQYNAFYGELTVRQNLELFAALKCAKSATTAVEIENICRALNLHEKLDYPSYALSGGQKRKLSIGIALIGGSKFVIFDEMTAGMDPLSRRQTWEMIKQYKAGRTIVVTTHFLDEADFLADRVIMMAHGKVCCSGRSLFLKDHFSKGYRLSFSHPNPDEVFNVVKDVIPSAEKLSDSRRQQQIVLPRSMRSKFSSLLRKLQDIEHIVEVSLNPPLLEEVFLNIAHEANPDVQSITVKDPVVKGVPTFRTHFKALLGKRYLLAYSDKKMWLLLFILPIIVLSFPLFIPSINIMEIIDSSATGYKKVSQQCINNLIEGVECPAGLDDSQCFEQKYPVRCRKQECEKKYNYCKKYPWICKIEECCDCKNKASEFYSCGDRSKVDITAFVGFSTQCPTKNMFSIQLRVSTLIVSIVIYMSFIFVPVMAGANAVLEMEPNNDTKFQQLCSGVRARTFWLANYVFDLATMLVLTSISLVFVGSYDSVSDLLPIVVLMILFAISILPNLYAFSFFFNDHSKMITFSVVMLLISGIALGIISYILNVIDIKIPGTTMGTGDLQNDYLNYFFNIFPGFSLMNGLIIVQTFLIDKAGKNIWSQIWSNLVYMVGVAIFSWAFVIFKEWPFRYKPKPPPEDSKELDEDVKAEKMRITNNITKDPISIEGLTRHYPKRKALTDLWLGIPYGQCFGYLGVNGAGKSTTMKILTSREPPTAGLAYLADKPITSLASRDVIGYCPQFDALFDHMSVEDHLRLYASIRGVNFPSVIEGWLTRLNMLPYRTVSSCHLSGGNKRKLAFAIASIGGPKAIFLDEPSTGVDAMTKRFMWSVIDDTIKKTNCAMILTTHSLEECEALCDRVGILIDGQMKCIGSIHHIKSKYGRSWIVEVYFATETTPNVCDICTTLEDAVLKENHGSRIVLEISKKKIAYLADVYEMMEQNHDRWGVDRYSVGETGLEDIFNDFAKEQKSLQKDIESEQVEKKTRYQIIMSKVLASVSPRK